MISEEMVFRTLEQFDRMNEAQKQTAFVEMQRKQPHLVVIPLACSQLPQLSREASRMILEMSVMVWHMMQKDPRPIRKVTRRDVLDLIQNSRASFEQLASDSEAGYGSAMRSLYKACPEPQILKYMFMILFEIDEPDQDKRVFSPLGCIVAAQCLINLIDALTKRRRYV